MTSFKNHALRSLLVLSALTALAACDGRRASSGLEDASFMVDPIDIDKTAVKDLNLFGLPERKVFHFKACLLDAINRAPIVLTPFAVSDGQEERVVSTDKDGCVLWNETHRVSSLQQERLLRIRRSFRAVSGYAGTVTLELAFNPWEEKLFDLRKFTPPDIDAEVERLTFNSELQLLRPAAGLGGAAQAYLSDVSMEFLGHEKSATQINTLLTLKPVQKFRLRLQPQFIRQTLKKELVHLDLKGGEFNVYIVVLRKDPNGPLNASDVIAEYQGPISVLHNGTATKDILLHVHDTAALLSRNHVFVALEPKGAVAKESRPGFYSGYIAPLKGNDADIKLIPISDTADDVVRSVDVAVAKAKESPRAIDVLTTYSGLKADVANANQLLSPTGRIASEVLASYCGQLYKADQVVERPREGLGAWFLGGNRKDKVLDACKRQPESYVKVSYLDLVEEIHDTPKYVKGLTSKKSLDVSISKSVSESTSVSMGYKSNVGVSANFSKALSFLPISFSLGAGADWSSAHTVDKGSSASASVTEAHSLTIFSEAYDIDATVRRCVVVQGITGREGGAYACSDKTDRRKFRETYYLVNHGVESSPFTDEGSADNTQWRLTIRGTAMYDAFEKTLLNQNVKFMISELYTDPSFEKGLLPDFKVTQEFPGAIPVTR